MTQDAACAYTSSYPHTFKFTKTRTNDINAPQSFPSMQLYIPVTMQLFVHIIDHKNIFLEKLNMKKDAKFKV